MKNNNSNTHSQSVLFHLELVVAHELVNYCLQLCQRRTVELGLILIYLSLSLRGPETGDLVLVVAEELELSDVAVFIVPVSD